MIYLFLAYDFEEIEALATVDILRRAGLSVATVSITEELQVKGAHNITVLADKIFSGCDFSDLDVLVLPGGKGHERLNSFGPLNALIRDKYDQGKYVAAICAAPIILSNLGLLKGKRATAYPTSLKKLDTDLKSDDSVVVDKNLITAKGAGLSIQFALKIVELLVGAKCAEEIKKEIQLTI